MEFEIRWVRLGTGDGSGVAQAKHTHRHTHTHTPLEVHSQSRSKPLAMYKRAPTPLLVLPQAACILQAEVTAS